MKNLYKKKCRCFCIVEYNKKKTFNCQIVVKINIVLIYFLIL